MRLITKMPVYDMTPVGVEKWYDRHTRCWVVITVSKDGFQVGEATYVHSKREALRDEQFRMEDIKK